MKDEQLREWVELHSSRYPIETDEPLEPLRGKGWFTPDDLEVLYRWKLKGLWSGSQVRRMRSLPPDTIECISRRAFSCPDELGAFRIVELLPGCGPATSSAVLTAHDPGRYTVMDVRAIRSLVALKRWDADINGDTASAISWLPYLDVCRKLSEETGQPLRTVDRALWQANGKLDLREDRQTFPPSTRHLQSQSRPDQRPGRHEALTTTSA